MFFRKLLGQSPSDSSGKLAVSPKHGGQQTMSASLQRKFAKGVQYNIRIIIKGDRNVGKTCLFERLQGNKFVEEYCPTDEIKATSIQWNYASSEDIVKVDIWDIVDKGKKSQTNESDVPLKLNTKDHKKAENVETCLDAEFVDVFKDTQGVIMMFNLSKAWTYDYIERELVKVPCNIPTLVLGNFRDQITNDNKQSVNSSKIHSFIKTVRHHNDAEIRYAECSMKNSYGLKCVHTFFNLPFLHLQRQTLMQKLSRNSEDIRGILDAMKKQDSSKEQNYDLFLDELMNPTHSSMKRSQSYDIESFQNLTSTNTPNLPTSKSSLQVNEIPSTPIDSKSKLDQFLPQESTSFENFNFNSPNHQSDSDDSCGEAVEVGSDEDEDNAVNPLVAPIQDDITSDDSFNGADFSFVCKSSAQVKPSSSKISSKSSSSKISSKSSSSKISSKSSSSKISSSSRASSKSSSSSKISSKSSGKTRCADDLKDSGMSADVADIMSKFKLCNVSSTPSDTSLHDSHRRDLLRSTSSSPPPPPPLDDQVTCSSPPPLPSHRRSLHSQASLQSLDSLPAVPQTIDDDDTDDGDGEDIDCQDKPRESEDNRTPSISPTSCDDNDEAPGGESLDTATTTITTPAAPEPLVFADADFAALDCTMDNVNDIKNTDQSDDDNADLAEFARRHDVLTSDSDPPTIEQKPEKSSSKKTEKKNKKHEQQKKRPKTLQLNDSSSCDDLEAKEGCTPLYHVSLLNEDLLLEEEEHSIPLQEPEIEKKEIKKKNKKDKKEKKSKKTKKNRDTDKKKRKPSKTGTITKKVQNESGKWKIMKCIV